MEVIVPDVARRRSRHSRNAAERCTQRRRAEPRALGRLVQAALQLNDRRGCTASSTYGSAIQGSCNYPWRWTPRPCCGASRAKADAEVEFLATILSRLGLPWPPNAWQPYRPAPSPLAADSVPQEEVCGHADSPQEPRGCFLTLHSALASICPAAAPLTSVACCHDPFVGDAGSCVRCGVDRLRLLPRPVYMFCGLWGRCLQLPWCCVVRMLTYSLATDISFCERDADHFSRSPRLAVATHGAMDTGGATPPVLRPDACFAAPCFSWRLPADNRGHLYEWPDCGCRRRRLYDRPVRCRLYSACLGSDNGTQR
eukprot:TRINITY_DN24900_c0_g1_i1.p1 TRINITY_DN24900_c0_g1~~TRINITY_DN24900_c0_g1_i1.p1  ORF type:complete len:312 (+),score=26.35 TRINITY_DN24900_c0_g1_i1:248-1183(+)